jgi:quercetin dioxygenase-like cupin family protein
MVPQQGRSISRDWIGFQRKEVSILRKIIPLLLVVLTLAGLSVGTAGATPSIGVSAVTTRVNLGSVDFVVQVIRWAPGATTGWHTHPGVTTVFVQGGVLTLYHADCSSQSFQAGERFTQPANELHVARNESSIPLVVVAIYPAFPPGAPIRIDQPKPPGCSVA